MLESQRNNELEISGVRTTWISVVNPLGVYNLIEEIGSQCVKNYIHWWPCRGISQGQRNTGPNVTNFSQVNTLPQV